jgi:hypothetical protein
MATADIRESHWLDVLWVVLVERSDRLNVHRVYLYRSGVNLRQRLDLNIVTPYSVAGLSCHVFLQILNHKVLEKRLLLQNVLHAHLTDLAVKGLLTVELV